MIEQDERNRRQTPDALARYLAQDAAQLAADEASVTELELFARCDAAMALTPKLAHSAELGWAFAEARRLARAAPQSRPRVPRWFERPLLAWSVAGGACAAALALAVALWLPEPQSGRGTPGPVPAAAGVPAPSITIGPIIVPAGIESRLAEIQPVVLIANQVPVDGRSVVVLPFSTNATAGDPTGTRLDTAAASIYQRLIRKLQAIPGLYVIEPSVAAAYSQTGLSPEQIALYLGVRSVVQAEVESEGDTLSLGLRVTDAAGDGSAFARQFDVAIGQIAQIEDQISATLLDALSVARPPSAGQSL